MFNHFARFVYFTIEHKATESRSHCNFVNSVKKSWRLDGENYSEFFEFYLVCLKRLA